MAPPKLCPTKAHGNAGFLWRAHSMIIAKSSR